jgi:rRNA maturation endonuclease Nob1
VSTEAPTKSRPVEDQAREERAAAGPAIRCHDCGDSYPTAEGATMLFALKSTCPNCGGSFELVLR